LTHNLQEGRPGARIPGAGGFLLGLFWVAVVMAGFGYYYQISDDPPYMDYDSATLGIFVNNLTLHDQHDYFFADQEHSQLQYRSWWATQFLPLAVPLSWVQRLLALDRARVGILLHVFTCLFGFLGCLAASVVMMSRGSERWMERSFVIAFVTAAPPFVLYLRTEVPQILAAFLLFWLAVLLFDRWLSEHRPLQLYALAAVLALFVLIPYPPLGAVPVVFALLLWRRPQQKAVVRDPHVYAAALVWLGLVLAISFGLSLAHTASYAEYLDRIAAFLDRRGHSVSVANLDASLIAAKIHKLANQHLLFLRDDLFDQSRTDDLWTLGSVHVVWIALLPVGLFGLVRGLRDKQEAVRLSLLVLASCYLFFLSFSLPEGRYLLVAVPCYAVFTLYGVKALKGFHRRRAAYAMILVVLAGNTFWLLTGSYHDYMHERWAKMDGVVAATEEIAREIHPRRHAVMSVPLYDFDVVFYLWMLIEERRAAPSTAESIPIYVLLPPSDLDGDLDFWSAKGFEVRRVLQGETAAQEPVLLRWRE
jgi:hypothetical protein